MLFPEYKPSSKFAIWLSIKKHRYHVWKNWFKRKTGLYRARGYYPQDPHNLRYWEDIKKEFPNWKNGS